MIVFAEVADARTIQEAQDHCQTLGMNLFSPVNSGQVNKIQEMGLQGWGFEWQLFFTFSSIIKYLAALLRRANNLTAMLTFGRKISSVNQIDFINFIGSHIFAENGALDPKIM